MSLGLKNEKELNEQKGWKNILSRGNTRSKTYAEMHGEDLGLARV